MYKIGIIGAGAMGLALAKGFIASKIFKSNEILFNDVDLVRLETIKQELGVGVASSLQQMQSSLATNAYLVLAVKPQNIDEVLTALNNLEASIKIISIAAGVGLERIGMKLPQQAVFRVMPNTPALINKAASAIAYNSKCQQVDIDKVLEMFSSIGVATLVEEKHLDAVTALSGSGPAYVFLLAEAMIEAGVKLGLDKAVAEKLSYQTIYGAACLMQESNKSASELREQVTSPKGTTQAALESFSQDDFKQVVFRALEAARARSVELGATH